MLQALIQLAFTTCGAGCEYHRDAPIATQILLVCAWPVVRRISNVLSAKEAATQPAGRGDDASWI
jgi:hypothetical protein